MRFNKNINGYENEIEFVNELNGKTFHQLKFWMQEFIEDLYPNINQNSMIICWKNVERQKADLLINIDGEMKRISIKKGIKNSIHVEPISEFIHFLIENHIPKTIILGYLKYHYADGTTNGTGKTRLSAEEYKKHHQQRIDEINESFNKNHILGKAIDRFLLQGRNSSEKIDVLIYGVIDDFVWIKRDDIRRMFFKKKNEYSSGVHFSFLSCQPMNRCLNYNAKYEKERFLVQLKWYNLFDHVIEYKNSRCLYDRYLNE